jgi:hypothetical protein
MEVTPVVATAATSHGQGAAVATTTTTNDDPILRMGVRAKIDAISEPVRKHGPAGEHVPVLVEVTVPMEGLAKVKRASLDLVLVLDVSSSGASMETKNKRLVLLDQAMKFIRSKLSSYMDRLAIIQVESGDCVKLHKV